MISQASSRQGSACRWKKSLIEQVKMSFGSFHRSGALNVAGADRRKVVKSFPHRVAKVSA